MKKLLCALMMLPMSLFAADFDRIGVDVSGFNSDGVRFGIADNGSASIGLAVMVTHSPLTRMTMTWQSAHTV